MNVYMTFMCGFSAKVCAWMCAFACMRSCIYIYNSVLTRRHRHSNSSASTPPNATKIAEMKVSQPGLVIVGPELLFSIYNFFFEFVYAR